MQETQGHGHVKLNVIVVNPKHFAVGIYYKKGETPLPKITVKGHNKNAQNIIKIAEKDGVPIFQDPELARNLYENSSSGNFVPTDMLPSVAGVLRWVYQLKDNK
jgi:type III secretion protein U